MYNCQQRTFQFASHVCYNVASYACVVAAHSVSGFHYFAVPKLEHPNFMPFTLDFNGGPATNFWSRKRKQRKRLEQLLQLEFCTDCAMKNGKNCGKAVCEDPEHWKKEAVKLLWDEGEDQMVSLLWHMMG